MPLPVALGSACMRSPARRPGGMGEVYCAHDARLDRDVAVKSCRLRRRRPGRRARFEREAAVAALSHPNILATRHRRESGADAVTDAAGGSVRSHRAARRRNPPRPPEPRRVAGASADQTATQIARGLSAAHDRGIVHRDSAENAPSRRRRIKILDFGLAKASRKIGAQTSPRPPPP